jgi:hypothetical protein
MIMLLPSAVYKMHDHGLFYDKHYLSVSPLVTKCRTSTSFLKFWEFLILLCSFIFMYGLFS